MKEIPIYKFAIREDLEDTGNLFLPTKGEPDATGWDVRAAFKNRSSILISPNQYVKIPLGIRGFCPPGWWYELKPRSSTFGKKNLHALIGTIDESFEGELIFAAQYLPDTSVVSSGLYIEFGEAIGQIIPVEKQDAVFQKISNKELDELYAQRGSQRGAGCFGSTDGSKI